MTNHDMESILMIKYAQFTLSLLRAEYLLETTKDIDKLATEDDFWGLFLP